MPPNVLLRWQWGIIHSSAILSWAAYSLSNSRAISAASQRCWMYPATSRPVQSSIIDHPADTINLGPLSFACGVKPLGGAFLSTPDDTIGSPILFLLSHSQ